MSYHLWKQGIGTHEGYHAFTAPTWLVAKEPDQLTTCNAVEPDKEWCLLKDQACRKWRKFLQQSDSRAKKHSAQYLLWSRTGDFISHFRELDDPVEMTIRLSWRQYNEVLNWEQISSCYQCQHFKWKRLLTCQKKFGLARQWKEKINIVSPRARHLAYEKRMKFILSIYDFTSPIWSLEINSRSRSG